MDKVRDTAELSALSSLMEELLLALHQYVGKGEDPKPMEDLMEDPDAMSVTVEGESPEDISEGLEMAEEILGKDLDGDNEEGEDPEHKAEVLGAGDLVKTLSGDGDDDELARIKEQLKSRWKRG